MTYQASIPQRHFIVCTEPSAADPAWVLTVIERMPDGSNKTYADTSEIEKCIEDVKRKQWAISERELERHEILELLGVSYKEYIGKLIAKRKAAA